MSKFFRDEFRWLLDFCGIKIRFKELFQPLDMIWAIENEMEGAAMEYVNVDFFRKIKIKRISLEASVSVELSK